MHLTKGKCLDYILQASFDNESIKFTSAGGETVLAFECSPETRLSTVQARLQRALERESVLIKVILPDGELLRTKVAGDPAADVASISGATVETESLESLTSRQKRRRTD